MNKKEKLEIQHNLLPSTLQQEAARKLNFKARKTMMIAQQLYEGIDLKRQGTVGLITYMRTDSTRISDAAKMKLNHILQRIMAAIMYLSVKPKVNRGPRCP